MPTPKNTRKFTYIDLFAGCGGFSLGLGNAGWTGLFAVEKDPQAFATFKANLIDNGPHAHFSWPSWLNQESTTIEDMLKKHADELGKLRGQVDLIVGGPPCQGFSLAGLRNPQDPRNKLSHQYIKMVDIIKPKFVLLENVKGFNTVFKFANNTSTKKRRNQDIPYSEIVGNMLKKLGYRIFHSTVQCERFGVPQQRSRFIMIGVLSSYTRLHLSPFEKLEELRGEFLQRKNLPLRSITVKEAIGDLEIQNGRCRLISHSGTGANEFMQLDYKAKSPSKQNSYIKLMRKGLPHSFKPNGLRLARHAQTTIDKFALIQSTARPGIILNPKEKESLGIKKQAICFLNPRLPSKTITTLPDDILHYSEPRILTVRENARIQSFPDDFAFLGKYTTGGRERTKECPRYTQVGNAVPPLLSEALGLMVLEVDKMIQIDKKVQDVGLSDSLAEVAQK